MFKLHPAANHLLIDGVGRSTPAEYARPGFVNRAAIDDVVAFVAR